MSEEEGHLLTCPSCTKKIEVEDLCKYTKSRAADVKASVEEEAYRLASSDAECANRRGRAHVLEEDLDWGNVMRGREYSYEDFMPNKKKYRELLTSMAFCPKCKRSKSLESWGVNDYDKKKIEELMKWSEWKEWNQYEDRRSGITKEMEKKWLRGLEKG